MGCIGKKLRRNCSDLRGDVKARRAVGTSIFEVPA